MNGDGLRTCAPVKSIKTSQQVFIGFKNLPIGYYRKLKTCGQSMCSNGRLAIETSIKNLMHVICDDRVLHVNMTMASASMIWPCLSGALVHSITRSLQAARHVPFCQIVVWKIQGFRETLFQKDVWSCILRCQMPVSWSCCRVHFIRWLLFCISMKEWCMCAHTYRPSRSRRDSPSLETETWRPARRPQKNRFVPINAQKQDFKPAFCLFSLFFSWNSSFFCVFWPFFMYPSVAGRYPNKKSVYIRALFWLKSSFFCHFPLSASNFVYIFINFRPIFLAVKCVESLTKTLKNAYLTVSIFKIFRGSMPPDPPRKARALPSQWSLCDHSLNHIISQVSRLQLSKSWQVCVQAMRHMQQKRLPRWSLMQYLHN